MFLVPTLKEGSRRCDLGGECQASPESIQRLASVPMDIIPDKRKVVGLVEQAYKGEICLPNFQRDFVWTREERQGTFRAHHTAICPEPTRTAEISAAGQATCQAHLRWSKQPMHKTRPTGRLTRLRALTGGFCRHAG